MGRASREKRARRKAAETIPPPELRLFARQERISAHRNPSVAGRKVSQCLGELVDPYVQDRMPGEHFRVLVAAGAIAWNLTTLPSHDRARELDEMLRGLNLEPENRRLFRALVDELQRRKESLYPKDDRLIASWDVKDQGGGRFFLTTAFLSE